MRSLLLEAAAGGPACLIDGGMSPEGWIAVGDRLLKADFDENTFNHEDLAWLDPAYDLAGALLELGPSRAAASELMAHYVKATGDEDVARRLRVAELAYGALLLRRWMLLVQEAQGQPGWADAVQRALAAEGALTWSLDTALADAFPVDTLAAPAGTVWCLDVDGVLEDPALGFPSTTPAGARAIRLMRSAGAAVILNTGRSLEELQMRCDALRLDGGVAEYGGVVWDHIRGRAETLVEKEASSALERVREAAAAAPGIHVDRRYRYSVRCRRLVGSSLKALTAHDIVASLGRAGGPALKVVEGDLQTDFASASTDKGAGLEAAVRLLGMRGQIVAMGDTGSDMPMLQRADRAYVPANASGLRGVGSPSDGLDRLDCWRQREESTGRTFPQVQWRRALCRVSSCPSWRYGISATGSGICVRPRGEQRSYSFLSGRTSNGEVFVGREPSSCSDVSAPWAASAVAAARRKDESRRRPTDGRRLCVARSAPPQQMRRSPLRRQDQSDCQVPCVWHPSLVRNKPRADKHEQRQVDQIQRVGAVRHGIRNRGVRIGQAVGSSDAPRWTQHADQQNRE